MELLSRRIFNQKFLERHRKMCPEGQIQAKPTQRESNLSEPQ